MGHRLSLRLTHPWSRPGIPSLPLPPEAEGSFLTSSPLTTTQQSFCCFILSSMLQMAPPGYGLEREISLA